MKRIRLFTSTYTHTCDALTVYYNVANNIHFSHPRGCIRTHFIADSVVKGRIIYDVVTCLKVSGNVIFCICLHFNRVYPENFRIMLIFYSRSIVSCMTVRNVQNIYILTNIVEWEHKTSILKMYVWKLLLKYKRRWLLLSFWNTNTYFILTFILNKGYFRTFLFLAYFTNDSNLRIICACVFLVL